MIKPIEPIYTDYSRLKKNTFVVCENCLHKCHCGVECKEDVAIGMSDKSDSCKCNECKHKEI